MPHSEHAIYGAELKTIKLEKSTNHQLSSIKDCRRSGCCTDTEGTGGSTKHSITWAPWTVTWLVPEWANGSTEWGQGHPWLPVTLSHIQLWRHLDASLNPSSATYRNLNLSPSMQRKSYTFLPKANHPGVYSESVEHWRAGRVPPYLAVQVVHLSGQIRRMTHHMQNQVPSGIPQITARYREL